MKRLFLIGCLVLSFGTANAALFVDLKGQPGSSMVTMTIWGSGSWDWNEYDDAIRFDNIEGGFAGDRLNNHGSLVNPENNKWIDIPGFTLNTYDKEGTTPRAFEFKRLLIESDDYFFGLLELDDFVLGTTGDAFWTYKGVSWSIAKTSFLIDLSLLGTPDSGATFDDLGLGTFNDSPDHNGHGVGLLTLNVSAVPVPAAVWLFASGLLGLLGISRRKGMAA